MNLLSANKGIWRIVLGIFVIALVGSAGYWLGTRAAPQPAPGETPGNRGLPLATDPEVLYWYDPMVPQQHFAKPGKSPFMDMQLLPRYAETISDGASSGVRIDPRMVQNLGIHIAPVTYGQPDSVITAVAQIVFNERESAVVQARTDGFVEQVYRLAPGDIVSAGAPLIDILVPTWSGAQKEFLALLKIADRQLTLAARERLKLLGMPDQVIRTLEKTKTVNPIFTVTAPVDGTLETLDVRIGMSVVNGSTLARINGVASIWLDAAVAESESAEIEIGAPVTASLTAYPGAILRGEVIDILPRLDTRSRTATVRALLPNPLARLRPGQYAQMRIAARNRPPQLMVPSQAVIRGVGSDRIILAENGYFRPVPVTLGREYGEYIAVVDGLEEGQQVVISGQFLIDSEANLSGTFTHMRSANPSDAVKQTNHGNPAPQESETSDNNHTSHSDGNEDQNRPPRPAGELSKRDGDQP